MRRPIDYRWKSGPLRCKLGIHFSAPFNGIHIEDNMVRTRRCDACPYYWYIG